MNIACQLKSFCFNPKFLAGLQSRVSPRNGFRTEATRKVPKAKPPKIHKKGDKPESSFDGETLTLNTKPALNLYEKENTDINFPDVGKDIEDPIHFEQRRLALDKLLGADQ